MSGGASRTAKWLPLLVLLPLSAAAVVYAYTFPEACVRVHNGSGARVHGAAIHFGETVDVLADLKTGASVTIVRRHYTGSALSIDYARDYPPFEFWHGKWHAEWCFDLTIFEDGVSVRAEGP